MALLLELMDDSHSSPYRTWHLLVLPKVLSSLVVQETALPSSPMAAPPPLPSVHLTPKHRHAPGPGLSPACSLPRRAHPGISASHTVTAMGDCHTHLVFRQSHLCVHLVSQAYAPHPGPAPVTSPLDMSRLLRASQRPLWPPRFISVQQPEWSFWGTRCSRYRTEEWVCG